MPPPETSNETSWDHKPSPRVVLKMTVRATCKCHIFIVYHWAPVSNYPRVWRGGSVCRVRGGGVGHALVALTYIPEVAGTRWHRWLLLLPRPRTRASLQCAHPRKPATSIDPAERFSTNGKKTKQMSEKLLQAHFVPEEREISSTRGIIRPHPLVPVCC